MRFRTSTLCVFVCLCVLAMPRSGAAQGQPTLKVPTLMFGGAALADWATTYHALKHFQVREANPILRPFDHLPGRMVGLGGALDIGIASAWNLSVGPRHPRIAAAGLWTATAFRAYLALHNLHNERRSARR